MGNITIVGTGWTSGQLTMDAVECFEKASRIMNRKNYAVISVVPLLFYACAKGYSFFTGANHLESGISKGTPGEILSAGLILPLNICVGIVVACTMYHFYTLFRKGGM